MLTKPSATATQNCGASFAAMSKTSRRTSFKLTSLVTIHSVSFNWLTVHSKRFTASKKRLITDKHQAGRIMLSCLRDFFSTLQQKYASHFPNLVSAIQQAVGVAIDATAPRGTHAKIATAAGCSLLIVSRVLAHLAPQQSTGQSDQAFKITNETKPVLHPVPSYKTHARNSEWEGEARSRVRTRAMKKQTPEWHL